jgi:SPP1 gp7 family putative phage head morphogenesis protein
MTIKNEILSDDEAEKIILGVYTGTLNVYNLPVDLYAYYVSRYIAAIDEIFTSIKGAEEQVLRALLYENVQMFSGAKTFQIIKDFESFLIEDGKPVEFNVFRKRVLPVYEQYNKTWLKTEYEFAVESARAGERWVGIWHNKETLPLLEYVTVGDQRVRESHKVLDGVIKPVWDSFWNTYYPPWSWRCRCDTKSLVDGEVTETKSLTNKTVILPEIKPFFKNNVGKTGKIFNGHHPYFKRIPDQYKTWAKLNFGLPLVKVSK